MNKLHQITLLARNRISSCVISLIFKIHDQEFDFKPGQWLDLYLSNDPELKCGGYSFASSPLRKDQIELLIRDNPKNEITNFLHNKLQLEESVFISMGQGKFFLDETSDEPRLFIAGGMGIAPLLSMVRTLALTSKKAPYILVHSVRSPEDLLHHEELEKLIMNDSRFRYFPFLSGEGRLSPVYLTTFLSILKTNPDCYICGPGSMNEDMKKMLLEFHIPNEKIKIEKWW